MTQVSKLNLFHLAAADIKNKKPSCSYNAPIVPPISKNQRPTVGRGRKRFFKETTDHTRYGDTVISNATINGKIRYGNLAHTSEACRQQLCI